MITNLRYYLLIKIAIMITICILCLHFITEVDKEFEYGKELLFMTGVSVFAVGLDFFTHLIEEKLVIKCPDKTS